MHGVANGEGIKLNSYKVRDEESKIGQKNSPTPIPRTSTSKQDDKNTNEEATSNKPSPILPQNRDLQFDETPPPVPPKNQVLQVLDLDTIVPLSSSSQGKDEPTHVDISEILHSKESPDNRLEESPYATIDKSKKTSKKNSDNEIDNPTLSRSASQETEFDRLLDRNESEKNLLEELSQHSDTPPSPPPSYKTDGSENSLSTDSKFKLQKNRVWPRAQYAMQQKGVVIFGAAAIVLGTSTALVYLQDKAKFITFFANSPLYIIVPIIAVASLLAISPMFLGIKQFVNTKEYQTQGKNADEVLDNVFRHQPEDKVIKSVRLEYSNGTHSNFVFNAWESKKGFVNIDEKVISKTNKIESVINNRPLFTALLTGVVAANIALPLLLYAEGGVNNIQKFYQNPLTNNIRLLPLIGLGIFALLAVYLGVHYYRKTNCTNLTYSEGKIDPKNVNEKFIEEIKRERTNVLGENHSKDAKCSSLTLEQVVVQSHNYPDLIYGVGR